jgi:hypothetical protein
MVRSQRWPVLFRLAPLPRPLRFDPFRTIAQSGAPETAQVFQEDAIPTANIK